MQLNRRSGMALIVVGIGIIMLLNGFGLGMGSLFGMIVPLLLMALGYVGIKNGRTVLGWSLVIIGFIMLLGKISGLLGILFSIGVIVFGIFLLKRSNSAY